MRLKPLTFKHIFLYKAGFLIAFPNRPRKETNQAKQLRRRRGYQSTQVWLPTITAIASMSFSNRWVHLVEGNSRQPALFMVRPLSSKKLLLSPFRTAGRSSHIINRPQCSVHMLSVYPLCQDVFRHLAYSPSSQLFCCQVHC
jgi:hypothetical protein